jgi:hypothetical protein
VKTFLRLRFDLIGASLERPLAMSARFEKVGGLVAGEG